MKLFSPNFEKEGVGVSKSEKNEYNYISFFQVFIDKFWILIKLNFLFILFCLPVVTIPASLGALTSISMSLVQHKHVFLCSDFLYKFKENWKQSTLISVLAFIFIGLSIFCLNLYSAMSNQNPIFLILFFITLTLFLFFSISLIYVFPILTTIRLPFKIVIKDSILLSIACFKRSLAGIFALGFIIISSLSYFPLTIPIFILIEFSVISFISSYISYPCIEKYLIAK